MYWVDCVIVTRIKTLKPLPAKYTGKGVFFVLIQLTASNYAFWNSNQ